MQTPYAQHVSIAHVGISISPAILTLFHDRAMYLYSDAALIATGVMLIYQGGSDSYPFPFPHVARPQYPSTFMVQSGGCVPITQVLLLWVTMIYYIHVQ